LQTQEQRRQNGKQADVAELRPLEVALFAGRRPERHGGRAQQSQAERGERSEEPGTEHRGGNEDEATEEEQDRVERAAAGGNPSGDRQRAERHARIGGGHGQQADDHRLSPSRTPGLTKRSSGRRGYAGP